LKDVMKKEEAHVLLLDESLNSVRQSKEMDIHIRSWNHDKHQLAMDGPSVNWKFCSMLTDEVEREHNSHII